MATRFRNPKPGISGLLTDTTSSARLLTPPKPPTFTPAAATPNLNALAAPPDFGAQASDQVSGILDPQLKDIAGRYDRQAGGVSDSFGKLTDQYQSRVAAAAGTGGMFDQAIGPMSAAAKGINAHLVQAGTDAAAKEQTALSASGLPTGAAGPDVPLAAEGAGAGGAAGAIGQNAINALEAAQKAALTYAGQLPGFAKGEGDQALHQTLSDLAGKMADQLATTTAQAPQLYLQIYNTLLDRAQTDKTFAEQVRQFNVNQKQQARTEKFTEAWGLFQSGAIDANQFKKMTGVAPSGAPRSVTKLTVVHAADGSTIAVNPYTGETVSEISGPGAPKPQKVTTFKGTDGRTYRYNPKTGSAVVIPGQAGPKPPKPVVKKGPLGLNAKDYQQYTSQALGAARAFHSTWRDKDGKEHSPLTWQQYLTHGEQAGIPVAILIKQGKQVYSQAERKQGLVPGG